MSSERAAAPNDVFSDTAMRLRICGPVIRPMLTSRHAEVSALAVFVGVIGGVSAFGFMGFVIGPVLISLVVEIVRSVSDVAPPKS